MVMENNHGNSTYRLIREKIGSGWHLEADEPRVTLIFQSSNKQEIERFLRDDIEDMKSKWPELSGSGWHLGTEDFGLVYVLEPIDS